MKRLRIPNNSVLAVTDKIIRRLGMTPIYSIQEYVNTDTNKIEKNLILKNIKGYETKVEKAFSIKDLDKVGILIFVNGEEPSNGTVSLDKVHLKANDKISVAYILQGTYNGDFKEAVKVKNNLLIKKDNSILKGISSIIFSYKVLEEDLKDSDDYEILTSEQPLPNNRLDKKVL